MRNCLSPSLTPPNSPHQQTQTRPINASDTDIDSLEVLTFEKSNSVSPRKSEQRERGAEPVETRGGTPGENIPSRRQYLLVTAQSTRGSAGRCINHLPSSARGTDDSMTMMTDEILNDSIMEKSPSSDITVIPSLDLPSVKVKRVEEQNLAHHNSIYTSESRTPRFLTTLERGLSESTTGSIYHTSNGSSRSRRLALNRSLLPLIFVVSLILASLSMGRMSGVTANHSAFNIHPLVAVDGLASPDLDKIKAPIKKELSKDSSLSLLLSDPLSFSGDVGKSILSMFAMLAPLGSIGLSISATWPYFLAYRRLLGVDSLPLRFTLMSIFNGLFGYHCGRMSGDHMVMGTSAFTLTWMMILSLIGEVSAVLQGVRFSRQAMGRFGGLIASISLITMLLNSVVPDMLADVIWLICQILPNLAIALDYREAVSSRNASGISVPVLTAILLNNTAWLAYGYLAGSHLIIIPCIIGLIFPGTGIIGWVYLHTGRYETLTQWIFCLGDHRSLPMITELELSGLAINQSFSGEVIYSPKPVNINRQSVYPMTSTS